MLCFMYMRKVQFANGEYYHIYNRGVDKRDVFSDDADYRRFLLGMILLNDEQDALMEQWRNLKKDNVNVQFAEFRRLSLRKPLVDIVAYCLNHNHYHFILKQIEEDGIKRFMHRLGTSYPMYFNKKYKRSGALFQGRFKSIHVDSNEYLLYLAAYVNQNHFIHGLGGDEWKYSSLGEYKKYQNKNMVLCNTSPIVKQFNNSDECLEFLKVNALYLKDKKENEKYLLEE